MMNEVTSTVRDLLSAVVAEETDRAVALPPFVRNESGNPRLGKFRHELEPRAGDLFSYLPTNNLYWSAWLCDSVGDEPPHGTISEDIEGEGNCGLEDIPRFATLVKEGATKGDLALEASDLSFRLSEHLWIELRKMKEGAQ